MVLPIAGRPENKVRRVSSPRTMTRPFLLFVHVVQPASVVHRDVADAAEVGKDAVDGAARLEKIADGADVAAGDDGSGSGDARTLAENVFVVAVGQVVLAQRRKAALHDRGPARPDEHDVFANRIKLLAVAGAEPFPETHQQQQGTNSPRNPEHGEKRAQFMRPEGAKGLPDNIENEAHAI